MNEDRFAEGLILGQNNGGGFGGNGWEGLIGLIVAGSIFANGGLFGNGNGRGTPATQADLSAGFANSEIMSDLNSILLAQAQGFAGLNTAIANTTSTLGFNMAQGFHGVDNAICTLGYNMATGFNSVNQTIDHCCCDMKSLLLENRYLNERQTCDILASQSAQTQRIIDYLTNEKITALTAENTALKGRISNDAQSAYLLERLTPCPKPSYLVPNPNCCYPTTCGGTTLIQ